MADSVKFVKSTPLRAIIEPFQHFADVLQTFEDVHEKLFFDKLTGSLT